MVRRWVIIGVSVCTVTFFFFSYHDRLQRLFRPASSDLIPGGRRMPIAPSLALGAAFPFGDFRSRTSTLALATPIAGTIHLPQLHCIPCHANFPMLDPQLEFGHVRRPESGASSACWTGFEGSLEGVDGKSDGLIHVRAWRKI